MVSAGGKLPWHGLGTILKDKALTAITATEAAKLNWDVSPEKVYDADTVELEDHRLLRRSDTRQVLSVVPKDWTPLQNVQLLEIAEALAQAPGVGDFQPVIETAGSLRGGKVVWALVQTGLRSFAGSAHRQYMLLTNGHYLGRGVRGTLTDVRVVCNNTLTAAENAKAALFTSHYGNVTKRVEEAIKVLGWATEATRATFAIYEALDRKPCSSDEAYGLFGKLLPVDDEGTPTAASVDKALEMMHLFKNGAGNNGKTMFDAVQAVTDWVDHNKAYRDTAGVDERRFADITIGGNGVTMKNRAFKMANQLAMA